MHYRALTRIFKAKRNADVIRKALLLDRLTVTASLSSRPFRSSSACPRDTLRRDLRELAAQGKLVRVHGGGATRLADGTFPLTDAGALPCRGKKQGLAKVAALT